MRHLLALSLFLLFALTACQQKGAFGPELPTPTPGNPTILGVPVPITFTELAENLGRFQDTLIRVSGVYTPLAHQTCFIQRGPQTRWSLINDNKQMRMLNFEQVVLPLAWEGLNMTVDGFWRKYEGPVGCGKNAPRTVIWYLEVVRIVEPNPMPDFLRLNQPTPVPGGIEPTPILPTPDELPTPPDEPLPGGTGYPSPGTMTPPPAFTIAPVTATPALPVTQIPPTTATLAVVTPTPTPNTTLVATPTTGTPTPTSTPTHTPGPGTPSATPLPTSGPGIPPTGYPNPTPYP
ncbi:MAG: hypothetical protein KJ063_19830 [Anaerolineae bacterium]|nr:hypothetical protein [Anaerolineae bacterium]